MKRTKRNYMIYGVTLACITIIGTTGISMLHGSKAIAEPNLPISNVEKDILAIAISPWVNPIEFEYYDQETETSKRTKKTLKKCKLPSRANLRHVTVLPMNYAL